MNSNKIFVSALFAFMLVASVFAVSTDPVFSTSTDVSDISEITDDVSASDIVESEDEIEADKVRYTKRTISSGSGWVNTDTRGALASIHLVSGYSGSEVKSFGWMKFGKLKLKLESIESTDTKKKFMVNYNNINVGTIVLNRGSTYQDGFAIWTGDLNIEIVNTETGNTNYDAKVNLAIEERDLGSDKIKDQRDRSQISVTGGLELDQLSFELKGKAESNLKKIELEVMGQNNVEGELVLEKISLTEYVGKLKVEEIGDEDDKLSGRVKVSFSTEGSTLYGPVTFVSEDGTESKGNIKLALSREVRDSSAGDDDSVDSTDDNSENRKEDRSGSNSGSDSENRGFWKRFIDFFGA